MLRVPLKLFNAFAHRLNHVEKETKIVEELLSRRKLDINFFNINSPGLMHKAGEIKKNNLASIEKMVRFYNFLGRRQLTKLYLSLPIDFKIRKTSRYHKQILRGLDQNK